MKITLTTAEAQIWSLHNDVMEGNINPLSARLALKALAEQLDEVIDAVHVLAVQEAGKYAGKQFDFEGFVIEKRAGTSRWSYPSFTPYNIAKDRAKGLEDLMKQVRHSGVSLVDAETGEVVPPADVTYSKETIAIKGGKK